MNVAEAILELQKLDPTAILFINDETPVSIKPIGGKIEEGYFGKVLTPNPKANTSIRYRAVTFTHWDEMSNGEVYESTTWYP